MIEEVKVLDQKLTASSCFLLLLFKEFLGSFIILLGLIIVVDIICILLKTHIIIPILIYNIIDHRRILAVIIGSSVVLIINELILSRELVYVDVVRHQS